MSEYWALVFALVALYLFECHCSASGHLVAVLFRRKLRSEFARPIATLHSLRTSIFRGSLLPAAGEVGFCEHVPKLSPAGLCTCGVSRGPYGTHFPLTSSASITVEGSKVYADTFLIADAASGAAARDLAELLSRMRPLSTELRSEEIRRNYRKRLDVSAAKHRLSRFNRVATPLSVDAWFLTIVMFGFLPASLILRGTRASLPFAALTLFLCGRQIVLFYKIHRAFYKTSEAREARRSRIWSLALSPPATIRIRDFLTRELLSLFDPLTVARATFPDEKSRQFTERTLRRLTFPAEFEKTDCPVAEWARDQFRDEVRVWAQGEYGDVNSLLRSPQPSSQFVVSYCPRCLQEFQIDRLECPDCPGVSLRKFDVHRAAN